MRNNNYIKLLMILFVTVIIVTGCSKNNIKPVDSDEKIIEEIKSETTEHDEKNSPVLVPIESQEETAPEEQIQIDEVDEELGKIVEESTEEPIKEEANEPTKEPEATEVEIEEVKENALKIEGKVGNKLAFTLDELKDMTDIIFEGNYYSLNSFRTTRHNMFKGVNLWSLLEQKTQILPDAAKISIIATDGYKMEFTIDEVKKQDYIDETNPEAKFPMIIAWEQDGEEYSVDEGAPFKLIIGQREPGDVNKPQWVSNIDKIIVD